MKYGIDIPGEGSVLDDFSALFLVEHGYAHVTNSRYPLIDTYIYEFKDNYEGHIVLPFFESPRNQSKKSYSFLEVTDSYTTIAGADRGNPPYVFIFSTKKPVLPTRNSKYGIEIFNNKGGIVHSSNYRTLDVVASETMGWGLSASPIDLVKYNVHGKDLAITNIGNSIIYGATPYALEYVINLLHRSENSISTVRVSNGMPSSPPQAQAEAGRLNRLLGVPTVSERDKAKVLVTVIDVTGISKNT